MPTKFVLHIPSEMNERTLNDKKKVKPQKVLNNNPTRKKCHKKIHKNRRVKRVKQIK
jgi:hypothetical protein